jgi:uncharacterized protein YcbK (DUF882 family)
MSAQASKHFKWKEFYCSLTKELIVSDLTLSHIEKLEALRMRLGIPLTVTSGYRSPAHNSSTLVGGAPNSMHLKFATDVQPNRSADGFAKSLDNIASLAEDLGFSGIGRYDSFVHLDCRALIGRSEARWDSRS